MTGPTLKGIATERSLRAILGATVRGHALHLELTYPVSTARKKMFTSNIYTVVNILGWASPISTLKEHSCGAMEHHLTSLSGRETNQIIFAMRIVFILLLYLKITNINGTM